MIKFFDYMQIGVPAIHMNYPEYKVIFAEHPCDKMLTSYTADKLVEVVKKLYMDEVDYFSTVNTVLSTARLFS